MTLIKCPECHKEISNKAKSCPHCGYPVEIENKISGIENEIGNPLNLGIYADFPELPQDLNIGRQIMNWWGNACVEGIYEETENDFKKIPYGKVNVYLHTHGISIGNIYPTYQIHNSQIISMIIANRDMLSEMDYSKFGVNQIKNEVLSIINFFYLVVQFWDIKSKKPQNLFISCNEARNVDSFLKRHGKERMKNITHNRQPKGELYNYIVFFTLIVVAIILIVIFL